MDKSSYGIGKECPRRKTTFGRTRLSRRNSAALTYFAIALVVSAGMSAFPALAGGSGDGSARGIDVLGWLWGLFLHLVAAWTSYSYLIGREVDPRFALRAVVGVASISGGGIAGTMGFGTWNIFTGTCVTLSLLWILAMVWVYMAEEMISKHVPRRTAFIVAGVSLSLFLAAAFGVPLVNHYGTHSKDGASQVVVGVVVAGSVGAFILKSVVEYAHRR